MLSVKVPVGKGSSKGVLALVSQHREIGSPHELSDLSLSGHVCRDKNRNRGVRDGHGRPRMPQVARPGRRGTACPRDGPPRQALADCNRGTWSSRRRGPGGDFDHAQSVNFQPDPTLRGGHSCSEPRHCGFRCGASRPSLPFLMNNARSKSNRSSRGFRDPAKVLCILSPALCLATPQPHSRRDFPGANFDMRRDGALEIRHRSGCVTGRSPPLCECPTLYNPRA